MAQPPVSGWTAANANVQMASVVVIAQHRQFVMSQNIALDMEPRTTWMQEMAAPAPDQRTIVAKTAPSHQLATVITIAMGMPLWT
jgi:hypothetical protein